MVFDIQAEMGFRIVVQQSIHLPYHHHHLDIHYLLPFQLPLLPLLLHLVRPHPLQQYQSNPHRRSRKSNP